MKPQGILVIQNWGSPWRIHPNPLPLDVMPFPLKKIWKRYRGLGGALGWPDIGRPTPHLIDGLASMDAIEDCRTYWENSKKKYPNNRIHFLAIGDVDESEGTRFIFLGYECGIINEYDNYSAIQNDLLLRHFQELEIFQRQLNKNLLFPSSVEAEAFLAKRRELLKQGYDLETDEDEFYPIPIYAIAPVKRKGLK